jgi:glutathione S-transferase
MRLFHFPGSRSTRAVWALEEVGADYEIVVVGRQGERSPDHLGMLPFGRVPALELDDGQVLVESAAICLQLGDLFPGSGLMPELGSDERGRAYQWSSFAVTELELVVFAEPGAADRTARTEAFAPLAAALRGALAEHEWIAGDRFTAADILCAHMVGHAIDREYLVGPDPLRDYVERARERPASIRAVARDQGD